MKRGEIWIANRNSLPGRELAEVHSG